MRLLCTADEALRAAAAARPQAPDGVQAPVSIRRQIHRLDGRIYKLAAVLEREVRNPNGNPIEIAAELQAARQTVAILKRLRDAGFEVDGIEFDTTRRSA